MIRIYLFRHGLTDWNAEGRIQGHLDVPLNDQGRLQARRIAAPLARLGIEAILSSDLGRALETARIIVEAADARERVPILSDPGLREIHLGGAQGLTRAEIEARFGVDLSNRLRHEPLGDADVASLGCETGEQVRTRALAAIERFARERAFRSIGVSSHGGVVRRILQHARLDGAFPPPIPNCAIFPLVFDPATGHWHEENFLPLG